MANIDLNDPKAILGLYNLAVQNGFINPNCFVGKPNELINIVHPKAFSYIQVGGKNLDTQETWGVARTDKRVDFIINKWATQSISNFHFTLSTHMGEIYDPFDPSISTYPLHKKRVVSEQYYAKKGL
jgi:hypothetical protein